MIALCIALVSGATLAKSSRVDVLHKPGTAAERTITISVSALPAHCRHGDVVDPDSDFSCGNDGTVIDVCHDDSTGRHEVSLTQTEIDEHLADGHGVEPGLCISA